MPLSLKKQAFPLSHHVMISLSTKAYLKKTEEFYMKKILLLLCAALSLNVFSSGGFTCEGEAYSGKKVSVYACMSHSDNSICSDIKVEVSGKEVLKVPADHAVTSVTELPALEGQHYFTLKAYGDSGENLLSIKYRYEESNSELGNDRIAALMEIRGEKGKLIFKGKDIHCFFE